MAKNKKNWMQKAVSNIFDDTKDRRIQLLEKKARTASKKDKQIKMLQKQVEFTKQTLAQIMPSSTFSPYEDPHFLTIQDVNSLMDIGRNSDIIRTIIDPLREKLFRNGLTLKEKFAVKCEECQTEFEDQELEQCPSCNSLNLREPDPGEKLRIEEKIKEINLHNQSLLEVLNEFEDDINIADNGYLLYNMSYLTNDEEEVILFDGQPQGILTEIASLSPAVVKPIFDKKLILGQDDKDGIIYFNPLNRTQKSKDEKPGWLQAFYKTVTEPSMYYAKNEIAHRKRYTPSKILGYSLLFAGLKKINTLVGMDEWMRLAYTLRKDPKQIIAWPSSNGDSLRSIINAEFEKVEKNPHYTPVITYEDVDGKERTPTVLQFMRSMDEMQWGPVREEFRKALGALYGVMPVNLGDVSASGGLNNEGMQAFISLETLSRNLKLYNEDLLIEISQFLGAKDWIIQVETPVERDIMKEIQLDKAKAEHAIQMKALGFDIKQREEDGDFIFSDHPTQEAQIAARVPGADARVFESKPSFGDLMKADEKDEGEDVIKKVSRKLFKELKGQDVKNKIEALRLFLRDLVESSLFTKFNDIYKKGVSDLEKDVNMDIGIDMADRNTLRRVLENPVYQSALDNFTDDYFEKIRNISFIAETEEDIVKILKKELSDLDYRINSIIETDGQEVFNVAKEEALKKANIDDSELKYFWVGPEDEVTTEYCKAIKAEVNAARGMDTLEDLEEVIKRHSDERIYRPDRPTVPHINCRHSFRVLRKRAA